ncbi:hypothetical protein KF947_21295 [Halomonas sp. FeN2]|uniref:hypothetical protein n=1 Tax=Halomonas sp. FeN2 TaxID=2832500 RepID=UPI001D0BC59F|nr:hypothetical protein [Halomonas sp. FeN2]UBR49813.1 hypothetical protein KF947_21295 [Halomonas sp. FeN2]
MSTKKTTQTAEVKSHADETSKDEGATPESTSTAAETATAADAGTTSATPEPPAPADDGTASELTSTGAGTSTTADAGTTQAMPEPPADDEPLPDQTVLILRDETIGGKDYRPGQTPKLPGTEVAALLARKAGDINPKAIAAARKARNGSAKEEAVIE